MCIAGAFATAIQASTINKINKFWKKIDSNYHFCGANTTDYHYLIFPIYVI